MDIFKIVGGEFNKDLRCTAAIGQIMERMEDLGYSIDTQMFDVGDINVWMPMIRDKLEQSLLYPNNLYFMNFNTLVHAWTINISNGNIRILSSWEGEYCFEEYSKKNKYGQFVEVNELLEKLENLHSIHNLKFKVNTPKGRLDEITEIYNELFRPGEKWYHEPDFAGFLEELGVDEINNLPDGDLRNWKIDTTINRHGFKLGRTQTCMYACCPVGCVLSGGGAKTIKPRRKSGRKISKRKSRILRRKSKKRSKRKSKRKSKSR